MLCLFHQGDRGDEGDIGQPGLPGFNVNNPLQAIPASLSFESCTCTYIRVFFKVFEIMNYTRMLSSLFSFQGAYGNPGEPGPSGDPVRLLIAVSVSGYS